MNIEVLSAAETEEALEHHRFGKTQTALAKISNSLLEVVDTEASVFATGLVESSINSLRTRMYRRDVVLTVRKVSRGGVTGHVIRARKIAREEQG